MKPKRTLTALLLAFMWAFAAQADDYNGVTVTAENGSIQKIGDELVVTFNQVGKGMLTLDGYALVRILVVGGGGSGSTGRYTNKTASGINYMGNGGSGGEAIEYDNHYLAAGAYEVTVGTGGTAVTPGDGSARTAGKPGGRSSFSGIVAKGGAGGVVETGSQNGTGSNTVKGWGSNLKTDISGETLTYSEGGAAATSATKAGSKGADRGCGGGGGGSTNYKSGAGGKGIVIVRIKAASVNPPATASFEQFVQYVEGVAVSPFDSIPPWAATITGTTNSTQRGHFSFMVSLKDGYVWSDTFGREDRTFKWAVVDDPAKGDTYLDVMKGVRADSSNPSNATISIIGHVPSEKVAVNVLFMGTMCYAHSLEPTTIQAAINSIAKRASVDWYLFHKQALVGNTGILRDYATDVASTIPDSMIHTNLSGSVSKGGVIDDNFVRNELDRQMQSNNHQALNSFMELLYEVSTDPARSKKYDYIVLEFDGSRVADGYTTDEHEAEVAAFLKPYYDAKKVVWLVDNCAANADGGNLEPYKNNYYRPCTYFHNGHSTQIYEDSQYRGLLALVAPDCYDPQGTIKSMSKYSKSWTPKTKDGTSDYYRVHGGTDISKVATETVYATDSYDIQIPYDDADGVSDYLNQTIQEKPYDLEFIDKIVDLGLEITAAHMSTSNVERAAADLNWLDVTDPSVVSIDINQAAHKVNAVVSNMCSEVWAKLDIDVRDTGSFRTGADPFTDEDLGRLVATKDPNDGNGFVSKYDPGDDEPTAQGDSPTLEPWKYNVYVVTGLVVNGTLKIDGIETNEAFKAEGYDCSVTYEPNAGYELDSISVDGEKLTDAELEEFSDAYDFKNIDKDHEIVVVYKQSIQQMGIEAFDAEKFYDAEPTNITYVVTNANGVAITPDKVYLREQGGEWIPAADFVPYVDTTNVTVEVRAVKSGFDPVTAEATVLVKPRPVTLIAASDSKVYDGLPLTNWTFTVKEDAAPEYGFVKEEGVERVTMTDDSTVTLPGTADNVIASEVAKPNTKLERNYIVSTEKGTLTVTAATMGIEAFDAEKFYDAEPTNITWVVTNAQGVAITDATIFLREKNTEPWIPVADFVPYVDTTNVIVEVKAEKTGFDPVEAEATVLVKPRPVTLIAASDSKVYDGLPLTNWTFTVKEDAAPEYGFVKEEGIASVTMTDDSTVTLPDTVPNVISSETAKPNTKLDRNYIVSTEKGTLTVTAASMGIEAFDAEKFYDAEPTNITYVVTNAQGVAITPDKVYLREKNTTDWIPVADFAPYVDTTNATVEVKAEKTGFDPVTAEATVLVKPRPVTLIAASDSKVYDGLPLTNWTFTVKEDAAPEYGFVKDEGVASVTMADDSTITLPGTADNVISSETAKPNTKLERNYVVDTVDGTLTVTAATMGIEAFPVEKFYDAEPTNITWVVTNAQGVAITPDKVYLREKGTDTWIPAADFTPYVDTTNVIVEVKAEKTGFDPVEAEATVLVKPRPVTLIAASDSKVYDGLPLTNWTFTVKEDAAPEYGFVKGEGVERVTMTDDSTVTLPDTVPNVISSETAKPNTKLDRNYVVTTEKGTLTVTAASMGIEAFDAEKFYDAEPTNITYVVTNAQGVAITPDKVYLREKDGEWVEAADFVPYVDTTNVTVEVKAEKSGFDPVTAEATVLVKPRPVTLIAASDSKVYDGLPLTNWTFTVKEDAAPEYGFVKEEGVERVTMTDDSTVTLPDTVPNVIASETAKPDTKLDRNYVVDTVDGTLTVTAASMGIEAFPVEKFYDAEPTNITWVVTNAQGVAITDAVIFLREKNTEPWIPVADFVPYVDTTNVTVEVRAEKSGFDPVEAEATVLVKPRPVTLIAASDSKVYDGLPLTNWTFTVKEDAAPEYGFVKEEGVERVTMTDDSTVTLPDTVPNVIASETAKPNTKLDRNYIVSTEKGTLTVTAAPMGIEAFDAEKFYDAEPTNITYVVTNAQGVAITPDKVYLREKNTDTWIPAADFVQYVDTTNVTVEVRAEKSGFDPVEAEATVLVKPRPVTLIAASDSKVYDGLPLTNWTFSVKEDAAPEYGFVKEEGVERVTMTDDSTVTLPGTADNVIASETAKPNTKLERNYVVTTEKGTLTVTAASMGIQAFDAEKFYDAEPTNITWVVTNATGGVISDAAIFLREKNTEPWIPVADFVQYVDTTNVTVEVRAEKSGFDPVEAEATVLVKPRPVTLIAASDSKVYDGLPLTNWTFTVKEDAAPEYGFVKEEGIASVTMTPASTITDPGSVDNVIASETAKPNTKLERNYVVSTVDGTLTVTAASMGIEAFDAEKFYDAEATNITWVVTNAQGVAITPDKVYLREKGTDEWTPAADFVPYVDATNIIVEVKAEKSGFDPVEAEATITILPRVVVQKAGDASKDFDGTPLRCDDSDERPGRELEEAEKLYGEAGANAIGFVSGEGFATVPMTADSEQTEPGEHSNVIDEGVVTLAEGTKPDNYVFFFDPGTLTVIQRQEEVRRDPDVEIPEESKEAVEESDKEIEKALDEMAKADQRTSGEPYVKYQLTVTPTNHLDGTTRTTPEKAAEDAKKQIELAESVTGSKIDKAEFVDIVLERTYSKEEAESTAAGDYHKDNWDPLDRAGEHGNTLFEVVIPVDVPEGMELAGVTRSCDNRGTEILKPRDPGDSNAEGFVYNPETKTVTLYAKDFCVFGFIMKEKSSCPCISCAYVYRVKLSGKTVKGRLLTGKTSCDATTCWAKPASLRIAGYVYGSGDETGSVCEPCSCNEWTAGAAMCHYWDENKKQVFPEETTFGFDLIEVLRNSGSKNKVQVSWTLDGLKLVGFGAFNPATMRLKNASGFFAGALAAPTCSNWNAATCSEGEPTPAHVFAPCTLVEGESQGAVSYGRWSMTYKADKVRAVEKSGTWSCLYPSGWQPTKEK